MRVLAIDQSSADVGIARVTFERDTPPRFDLEPLKIKIPKATKADERNGAILDSWRSWLRQEIGFHGPGADLVICEDFARVHPSGIINHKVLGQIEMECYRQRIRLIKVPIQTLKLYATGDGAAKKPAMIAAAQSHYGSADPMTDDVADAYHMSCIGYHILLGTRTGNPVQNKILDTLARTPEQVKAEAQAARLAKAAATIAADEAKQRKATLADERAQGRAQRQGEVLRKREERLSDGPKTRTRPNAQATD